VLQEAACRLVKSAGDDSILDQILSDGVKATRKCKGKKVGINQNKAGDGDLCKKTNTSGKKVCNMYFLSYVVTSYIVTTHIMHCISYLQRLG
jgi:hypothetical protein